MSNKIPLTIAGYSMVITTDEEREHVEMLASSIEKDILAVMDGSARASSGKAAIVCALDYYDKLQRANSSAVNMRNQIRDYLSDAASAKLVIDERDKTIEELQRQLSESAPTDRVRELTEQITAEKEKNTLLYRELDSLSAEIKALKSEKKQPVSDPRVETLTARLSAAEDDITDLREENGKLRSKLESGEQERASLASRAQKAESESENLRSQLKTLEQMIDEENAGQEESSSVQPDKDLGPVPDFGEQPHADAWAGHDIVEQTDDMPDLKWTDEVL